MSSPIHVILNPRSGRGTGERLRPEVERELTRAGLEYILTETTARGHAVELARDAAEAGVRTIVAAGGDGTIHEVVNGIMQARGISHTERPTLGVIPIGTGNDFVKSVNGTTDRGVAYHTLAHGAVRSFDLGRISWLDESEYFTNGVGTGIDVEVVRQITRLPRLPGVISYLIGLVRALFRFRPLPVHIDLDGESIRQNVMIVAVGNGFCLGGGFRLFPDARPDDGLLDLCVVDRLNIFQVIGILPKILSGKHTGHPDVSMRNAASVVISAEGKGSLFFQVDGELREPTGARRLEIEIVRAALPVLSGGSLPITEETTETAWPSAPEPQLSI